MSRRIAKSMVLLLAGALVGTGMWFGRPLLAHLGERAIVRKCLGWQVPSTVVVYETDRSRRAALMSGSADYVARGGDTVMALRPFEHLRGLLNLRESYDVVAPLNVNGRPKIVGITIGRVSVEGARFVSDTVGYVVIDPGPWYGHPRIECARETGELLVRPGDVAFRLYGPTGDPHDPASAVLAYECGESHGRLRLSLRNDLSIALTPIDGPLAVAAAARERSDRTEDDQSVRELLSDPDVARALAELKRKRADRATTPAPRGP